MSRLRTLTNSVIGPLLLLLCASIVAAQETPDDYGFDTGPPSSDLGFQFAHTRYVQDAALSPNGQVLATASEDHTTRLWDVGTGRLLRNLLGHNDGVSHVVFTADGKLLATASHDKSVKIWSVNDGRLIQTLRERVKFAEALVFSSDGAKLAVGDMEGPITIWDWQNRKVIGRIGTFARLVAQSDAPIESKRRLFFKSAQSTETNRRSTGIEQLLVIGDQRAISLLRDWIHSFPSTPEGKYSDSGAREITYLVQAANAPELWQALKDLAIRSDTGQRMEIVGSIGYGRATRQARPSQIAMLATFLNDSTERVIEGTGPFPPSSGKYAGYCVEYQFKRLRVNELAAIQLARLLGLRERPQPNWTSSEWNAFTTAVKNALGKER